MSLFQLHAAPSIILIFKRAAKTPGVSQAPTEYVHAHGTLSGCLTLHAGIHRHFGMHKAERALDIPLNVRCDKPVDPIRAPRFLELSDV
ncbi:hypothetical protein [Streptomyces sp. NPDC097610]|uniref:hypothetical protein n=1 Tax=Streptomyces sp. NPDC097610 TaxID=3157227 RepID=UPI0033235890